MLSGVERKAPVCRHWARHGACRHGDACRFVHGGTISSASVDEGRGGDGAADDDRKSREIEARVAILRAELRALRRSHAESCRQSHVETQSPASGADDAAAGATAPVGTSRRELGHRAKAIAMELRQCKAALEAVKATSLARGQRIRLDALRQSGAPAADIEGAEQRLERFESALLQQAASGAPGAASAPHRAQSGRLLKSRWLTRQRGRHIDRAALFGRFICDAYGAELGLARGGDGDADAPAQAPPSQEAPLEGAPLVEALQAPPEVGVVLDIAGGKGNLARALAARGVGVLVVDPRRVRRLATGAHHQRLRRTRRAPAAPVSQVTIAGLPARAQRHQRAGSVRHLRVLWRSSLFDSLYPHPRAPETADGDEGNHERGANARVGAFEHELKRNQREAEALSWGGKGLRDVKAVALAPTVEEEQQQSLAESAAFVPEVSCAVSVAQMLQRSPLVLGFHPDQATTATIEFAVLAGKTWAVVPCCVYGRCKGSRGQNEPPQLGEEDRPGAVSGGDGEQRGGYSYSAFVERLRQLGLSRGSQVHMRRLPFDGKNIVLCGGAHARWRLPPHPGFVLADAEIGSACSGNDRVCRWLVYGPLPLSSTRQEASLLPPQSAARPARASATAVATTLRSDFRLLCCERAGCEGEGVRSTAQESACAVLTATGDETDGKRASAVTGEIREVTRNYLQCVENELSLGPYEFSREVIDTTAGCAFVFVAKHVPQAARSEIVPHGDWSAFNSAPLPAHIDSEQA